MNLRNRSTSKLSPIRNAHNTSITIDDHSKKEKYRLSPNRENSTKRSHSKSSVNLSKGKPNQQREQK